MPTRLGMLNNPSYIARRGLYEQIAPLAAGMAGAVLDFGCGSKPYVELFHKAASYTGVDIEVSGHDHRSSKVDHFYDGKRLPFADAAYDAVVSFQVLEHVFNIDEVLAEIARVLKPGGRLLITVPFVWEEHETPFDFGRYTSYGLAHVLHRVGFETIEHKRTTTYMLTICQAFITYVYQFVLPQSGFFAKLLRPLALLPMHAGSLMLNFIMPKRYEYYCDNVVLARKSIP